MLETILWSIPRLIYGALDQYDLLLNYPPGLGQSSASQEVLLKGFDLSAKSPCSPVSFRLTGHGDLV